MLLRLVAFFKCWIHVNAYFQTVFEKKKNLKKIPTQIWRCPYSNTHSVDPLLKISDLNKCVSMFVEELGLKCRFSSTWISRVISPGHRQSHTARSDPQPLGFVSEAAGPHPRGRLASPLCLGHLQGKWTPEEPGPGIGQSGLPGTGCGGIFGGRTLPGQVRYQS